MDTYGIAAVSFHLNPAPEGRCLIGLSGGADSVALLRAALMHREDGLAEIEAVHVNHGLRGEESDGDERFVRKLCAELEVPLHVRRLDLKGRTDENAAREGRYAAFEEVLRDTGIHTLMLAHQKDDQAETMIMRLMRGAGPEGLGGMKPIEKRDGYTLVRPLLNVPGEMLREALREAEQPWREDASNQENTYLRNRVRHELIPRMEEMIPGAAGRIARAAELISEENEGMEWAARMLMAEAMTVNGLKTDILRAAPESLRNRTLRIWWRENGPKLEERELSFPQTFRLGNLVWEEPGKIINLPAGWRARREKTFIRLMDPEDRTKNNRPPRKERGNNT